jgi:hypothetical protein
MLKEADVNKLIDLEPKNNLNFSRLTPKPPKLAKALGKAPTL